MNKNMNCHAHTSLYVRIATDWQKIYVFTIKNCTSKRNIIQQTGNIEIWRGFVVSEEEFNSEDDWLAMWSGLERLASTTGEY